MSAFPVTTKRPMGDGVLPLSYDLDDRRSPAGTERHNTAIIFDPAAVSNFGMDCIGKPRVSRRVVG